MSGKTLHQLRIPFHCEQDRHCVGRAAWVFCDGCQEALPRRQRQPTVGVGQGFRRRGIATGRSQKRGERRLGCFNLRVQIGSIIVYTSGGIFDQLQGARTHAVPSSAPGAAGRRFLALDDMGSLGFVSDANPMTDDALVQQHEKLVRKLAIRIQQQLDLSTDLDELMAYGFKGLVEASHRFDPSRGVQFSTFAYYRVRGAIFDGVREMAYLSRKIHARRKAAEATDLASEDAASTRAQNPSDRANALRAIDDVLTKTTAAFLIASVGQDPESDAPVDPEAASVKKQEFARVRGVLSILEPRERALIEGFYFHDRSLEDVGKELGISKSWASRLHARALGRLRDALTGAG